VGKICIWRVADFSAIFAAFRQKKIGGFLYMIETSVSFIKSKDPLNTVYYSEIHFCLLYEVVWTSVDCFSPVETLWLVRL